MKRFSIIIPNYNKEKYIRKCLDSVFQQTIDKSKYEVIVIEDGSTDSSINIINEYDVKLLKTNRLGAGGARNRGIDVAEGEYVFFLDSDDFLYEKNVLDRIDKKLFEEEIVFVKYKEIKGNQEKIIEENNTYSLEEQICKSKYFCCTLKCFKRRLVNDIRYKERCYHEDISFIMELMCKAKTVLYFDEITYVYYKEIDKSTVDNYTLRKALDFTTQILEFLYFIEKYPDKQYALLKRTEREDYKSKITKLENWAKNKKVYTYKSFIEE